MENDKHEKDLENIFVGVISEAILQKEYPWYTTEYDSYNVDSVLLDQIRNHSPEVSISIYMATWCPDCHREIPRFYKILNEANIDESRIVNASMDENKQTPDNYEEGMNVTAVPTFIFFKHGEELGRIVEKPKVTLEHDILEILKRQV